MRIWSVLVFALMGLTLLMTACAGSSRHPSSAQASYITMSAQQMRPILRDFVEKEGDSTRRRVVKRAVKDLGFIETGHNTGSIPHKAGVEGQGYCMAWIAQVLKETIGIEVPKGSEQFSRWARARGLGVSAARASLRPGDILLIPPRTVDGVKVGHAVFVMGLVEENSLLLTLAANTSVFASNGKRKGDGVGVELYTKKDIKGYTVVNLKTLTYRLKK